MADRFGVTGALNRWLDEAAVAYLDQVDVEKLTVSDPSLRTGPLVKTGIMTVGQAYHYSPRAMERLPGMGGESVRAVKKAAREYISEARKEVPLRIDAEARTAVSTKLIQALYG